MANKEIAKKQNRQRRARRVRAKVFGTAKKPRLNVFRSLKHVFVQLIDDQKGKTLVSAKDTEIKDAKAKKAEIAFKVGELVASKAKKLGIEHVTFDKSGYRYHGRIKAIADGARKGGLIF